MCTCIFNFVSVNIFLNFTQSDFLCTHLPCLIVNLYLEYIILIIIPKLYTIFHDAKHTNNII